MTMRNRWTTRLTGLLAVAALAMGGAVLAAPAGAAPAPRPAIEPAPTIPLPPEFDNFYRPSASQIAAAQPGQIIRARRINPGSFMVIPLNVDAWQLLYRTNNSSGQAISTVTTVLKPRGAAPAGGRKLLSYQIAIDSVPQYCQPSYLAQVGGIPADYVNAAEMLIPIAAGVGQGWTVAIPDYEGPNGAYGAARQNAQATLDGIRAVESFSPAQTSGVATPTALWGYSGGTIPSSFVPEIKDVYAPELNIVGSTSGGVAPADFAGVVKHNNNGLYTGLVTSAFVGLASEYPDMERDLNARSDLLGKAVFASRKMLCHPQGSAFFPFLNYLGMMGAKDPLTLPSVRHAIADNALGQRKPTIPQLWYHGVLDEIIPIAGPDKIAKKYCEQGADLTYLRDNLAEHIIGVAASAPPSFNWVADRLNGVPLQRGCRTTTVNSTMSDPKTGQALAKILPNAAQLLVGVAIGAGRR